MLDTRLHVVPTQIYLYLDSNAVRIASGDMFGYVGPWTKTCDESLHDQSLDL
jgi:hypothetical protein